MRRFPRSSVTRRLSLPGMLVCTASLFLAACYPYVGESQRQIPPQVESDSFTIFYPPEAYEQQLEGRVLVKVRVEKDGSVSEVGVKESSGHAILDEAAVRSVRAAHFIPGTINGKARNMWMTWPIVFKLTSKPVFTFDFKAWQRKARECQQRATTGEAAGRQDAQRELLKLYLELGNEIAKVHSTIPNSTILVTVSPAVGEVWADFKDVWPLGFVLYLDYLQRFPEAENASDAERMLVEYMESEISLLRSAASPDSPFFSSRQHLLAALVEVLKEHQEGTVRVGP